MSHTPGPWKASGTKALGYSEVVAPGSDFHQGHLVAIINTRYGVRYGVTERMPREQTDANARLIAAAPDLLEACRMVVDRWEEGDLAEAVRACDAAIAKATGEDSV